MSGVVNAETLQALNSHSGTTSTNGNGHTKVFVGSEEWSLLQEAVAGSEAARAAIYTKHLHTVYCICLRMLKNHEDAEDLAQDVFIQLFRKLGDFRGDSAFSTWLHRLTVNQVLMYFRKRRFKYEFLTDEGEMPEPLPDSPSYRPPLSITDKMLLDQVIRELPKGYRNVFTLHDIEGFEHEEVAVILGCSVGTSKSQLHKARLKLQKLIKKKANPKLSGQAVGDKRGKFSKLHKIITVFESLAQSFDDKYQIELPSISAAALMSTAEEFDLEE